MLHSFLTYNINFPCFLATVPPRYSAEDAADLMMKDDNGASCDESEFSSSDDEIGNGDSESEYTWSSSSSSSSENENDDTIKVSNNTADESESEVENDVQQEENNELRPLKRARTRGGCIPKGVRTRGGCISAQRSSTSSDNGVMNNSEPARPITKAEKKKREKDLEQAAWKDEPNKVSEFAFDEQVGLKINMEGKEKMDFYNLFLTDELIDLMTAETNRYAEQEIDRHRPLRRNSRYKSWKPVDSVEMKKFIGILYLMGIVRLPTIELYWSRDVLYRFNGFTSVMSRNRFQEILRFWHFSNNEEEVSRLGKVMPLIDHLNNKMKEIYQPERGLSIDESMMLWRGRLVFKQYIKNKRHKYGVKFYELCQSEGLVLKVHIYSGESVPDEHNLGQTGAIVLNLMEGLLQKGYRLYVDNYYNSFELAKHLIKEKTYICGTLRSDRTSNPVAVTKAKLKKGEVIQRSRDGVTISKWKDKRDVLTISNMHAVEMVETSNRRGKKMLKPNIVKDYNAGMSGVDKADQMISYYDSLRKTVRWYKKVGLHILDIMMYNSYALNVMYGTHKQVTLIKYREHVIKSLIDLHNGNNPEARNRHDFHYLMPLPPTEKKEKPTKPCVVCSRLKRRKETRYFCGQCHRTPALCIGNCFKDYHLK